MTNKILHELKEHIPYTLFATFIAMIITLAGYWINRQGFISQTTSLFYIFHPAHIFFSAIVSTAIFYKYKNKIFPAIAVGFIVSIFMGSLSDVIFPYIGGIIFNLDTSFHLPIIENTLLISVFAIAGCIFGVFKFTKIPHFLHVFLSVFASLMYLLAYSIQINILIFILISIIVFVSVVLPCCLGDIVFPLIFEKIRRKE